MNKNSITALKICVGKAPKIVTISNDLESLQNEVNGDIEQYMPYTEDVAFIVNEEGKMKGMPLNRAVYDEDSNEMIDIIAGDFLIVHAPWDSENYENMPQDLLVKYFDMFKKPENFFYLNGKIQAVSYEPEEE